MGRNKVRAADPFCKNKTAINNYRNGLRPGMKTKSNDLAPKSDDQQLTRNEQRLLSFQPSNGIKTKRRSHVADTRGLEKMVKQHQPKPIHEFKTEMREGESFRSYSKRIGEEKRRVIVEETGSLKKMKQKKRDYLDRKKEKKMDKKLAKLKDNYEEKRFRGEIDHIPFGEVADRPPSFDDLPQAKFKQGGTRVSDLARLQKALLDAERAAQGFDSKQKPIRTKVELDSEFESNEAPRAISFDERQKMLAKARNDMRKAEVDRAREDVQKAYKEMKARNHRGGGLGLSSLQAASIQLSGGVRRAQVALNEIDGE